MTKIPSTTLAELNRQMNTELGAAHAYRALSHWCKCQNLPGFSRHFAKQVADEEEHAEKIIEYLIDRGETPELSGVPAPKCVFKSLQEAARHAQDLESANTQGVHAVYESALASKDYATQVLMQWFITEQVEEEAASLEMVERAQAASCAGGLSDLDRHIEEFLEADDSGKS